MRVRSAPERYILALTASLCAAGAGIELHSWFGYRFPLITFYPVIMLSAWFGGLWPGVAATLASTVLVDYLWLNPLRASHLSTAGDAVALVLFVGTGLAISGFSESLHRSTARERIARTQAEAGESALTGRERQLRAALAGEHTARAEAEEANRLKDQFLAMVSHELRTPLNAVLGWADMLKDHVLDERGRGRAVQAIHANARRQAQLVDDLLDIAGMMTGKLQLRRTAVNVEEIARAAVEIVQPAADRKQIEIAFHLETPVPALEADAIRIQQVFWNLLSNAIKFTPEHGVIHLHVRQAAEAVEIVVRDTGQGIPGELLRSIFDPFRQADSSTTRVHGGLGLGLSIVKYIAEAHAGSVDAESPGTGRGSTFTVRLPLRSPTAGGPESAAPASSIPARARLPGVKVLVVDDDADTREVVAAYLEQQGMSVQTAASAAEAMEIVQREPVAVLLVDLAMPDQDGYTFIRGIRSSPSPGIAALPAAALSALARVEDQAQALRAGFQLHVAKPVNSTILVNAVALLLEGVSIPN